MVKRLLNIILCLCLTLCCFLPKRLNISADTPTESNRLYLYTYNGTTYNSDKKSFPLDLTNSYYTTTSVLHNVVVLEIYPYEFYQDDYLKLQFMLDLYDSNGDRLEVEGAGFFIYNNIDKTSSSVYPLEVIDSEKQRYSYLYYGRVDGADKPGNSLKIHIYLPKTVLGTTGIRFHMFDCDIEEDGKQTGLLSSISGGISDMVAKIANLPNLIANALSGLFQGVSNAVSSIGSSITSALTTVKNAITSALTTVKDGITSALDRLGETILNGIKDLFLPSDDFIEEWFSNINKDFSLQFGFLYYPIEFIAEFFTAFQDVLSDDKAVLSWDDLKFNLPLASSGNAWNDNVTSYKSGTIIEADSIDLVERRKALFRDITVVGSTLSMNAIFYYFTDAIIYFALVNLAYRKIRGLIK